MSLATAVDPLADLLAAQSGVVSRSQCRELGCSDKHLQAQVRARRWQRLYPGVYAAFTGPVPRSAQLWAAVLYAGPGAVLSHASAAELWGFARAGGPIHVTVPANRKVRPQPGLVIHRSRAIDAHPSALPPRTRVEATVRDWASLATSVDEAIGRVCDACRSRVTTPGRLQPVLAATGGWRWRSMLLEVLAEVADGAHSPLEVRYARIERAHGLPTGRRQARVVRGRAVQWLDVVYDPYRTRAELDGRLGHEDARARWRDMSRDNAGVEAGEVTLRYGWPDVAGHACVVAGQVARTLQSRGWTGVPKRCGTSCPL